MNRTRFVTISAVVSLVYGAVALIAPAALTSVYGVGLDRAGLFLVQFLGASYIGYAIIGWFTRTSADPAARRGVALGIVVSTMGMIDGIAAPAGWSIVALTVVFAAGWAYVALIAPGEQARDRRVAS